MHWTASCSLLTFGLNYDLILEVVVMSFGRALLATNEPSSHLVWGQLARRNRGLAVKPFLPFLLPSRDSRSCIRAASWASAWPACANPSCPCLAQQAGSSRDCAADLMVGISVGQLSFLFRPCSASQDGHGHRSGSLWARPSQWE